MNHFERLVRRAQLSVAPRSPRGLADPFEQVASLDLDPPPANHLAPGPFSTLAPSAALAPSQPAQGPLAPGPATAGPADLTRPDSIPLPPQAAPPILKPPRPASPSHVPSFAESLRPSVHPEDVVALSQADAFMGALRPNLVPARPTLAAEAPPRSLPVAPRPEGPRPAVLFAPAPAAPDFRASSPLSTPGPPPGAEVLALVPPTPQRLRSQEQAEQAQGIPSTQREAAPDSPARPVAPPAIQPQIVVMQTSSTPGTGTRVGAGSPRFGLGQL